MRCTCDEIGESACRTCGYGLLECECGMRFTAPLFPKSFMLIMCPACNQYYSGQEESCGNGCWRKEGTDGPVGGRKCLACAADYAARIADLEAGVAAGKRAAQMCREYTDAMKKIEDGLDARCAPPPYPGKAGIPGRVEALQDAWSYALQALRDVYRHPGDLAAMDHARAVLSEAGRLNPPTTAERKV
jgi:hypothetical protein